MAGDKYGAIADEMPVNADDPQLSTHRSLSAAPYSLLSTLYSLRRTPYPLLVARLATPGAVAALCVLSAAFFWQIVVLHDVLLPTDILFVHDPLWRPLVPAGFGMAANPLDSDALTEFYPWTALAAQALHQGIVPLWNPYAFAGTPFLAAMQTAVFYPINLLLEWLVAPVDVLGLRAIAHLAVALVGAFLFARRLRLSYPAALLAALAFGLSLPYIVWIEHPMAGATAWLPWLLLCIDRVIATRGHLRWVVVSTALVAVEVLAGHGESTAHVLLLCGAYALFRAILAWREGREPWPALRALLALGAALILGLAIAAAYLLPTLAQLPLSEAAYDRTLAAPAALLGDPTLWKTLPLAIVPYLYGNPTWGVTSLPNGLGYNESVLYAGAIPLALAVLALLRRREAHTIFFAAVALAALGVAVRLPLFSLVDNFPLLRITSNGRLRIEYVFALALLAGYGLDTLTRAAGIAAAWRLARAWGVVVLVSAILAMMNLLRLHSNGHTVPLATAALVALPALWLGLFAGVLWLRRRARLPGWAPAWLALVLVGADLASHGMGYHTIVPRAQALATPPAVHAISGDHALFRVVGLGETLMPSMASLYGLQDVRGYDPAYAASYERYFDTAFTAKPGMRLGLAARPPSPARMRAFDLLNVKYIFVDCDVPLRAPSYHLIYHGGGCVYRNEAVLPRALLVHGVVWATPARAVSLLGSGAIDPRRTVLLDPATAQGVAWRGVVGTSGGVPDEVRVTHYALNSVTLAVRARARGLLLLADAYAPGWQAHVDGQAAPIARADAILRAVPVGRGAHVVQFTYQPPAYSAGMAISIAALALWLLLALLALYNWHASCGLWNGFRMKEEISDVGTQ